MSEVRLYVEARGLTWRVRCVMPDGGNWSLPDVFTDRESALTEATTRANQCRRSGHTVAIFVQELE